MWLRDGRAVAAAAAVATFVVALRWGTFAAGGSDSACYLNQSRLFAAATTHVEQPLSTSATWPRAEWTFAPVGHIPSPARKEAIVPICPPGLPIAMAAARIVHVTPFLIVPLAGALAVWLTFLLGRRFADGWIGAGAAILLACSPVFLFQVVQPMTDVPAAALWLLAVVLAISGEAPRPLAAGLAASMAILTRPNLMPLAGVLLVYLVVAGSKRTRPTSHEWRGDLAGRVLLDPPSGGWFLAGLVPGLAVLAVLQTLMYGSPTATGYGAPSDLFKTANILPNLARYPRWLAQTQSPLVLLALAAPFVTRLTREAWLGLALAAVTLALYLPYTVFDDWWYLRFLLPALPFLIVLPLVVLAALLRRTVPRGASAILAITVVVFAVMGVSTARERRAFELRTLERHFVDAGTFAADRLPASAAVFTIRHSGSVHYYSQRVTLSWDTLEAGSLDATLAFLRAQRLTPIFLLDATEEPEFRAKFGATSVGELDWPPLARIGRTMRVYDPADRARFLAGERIDTIDWPARTR